MMQEDAPVAHWSFAESKGAKTVESTGTAKIPSGKVMGKVNLVQPGPRPTLFPMFDPGNQAAEWNGGKDLIQVADSGDQSPLDFDTGDVITLEAWVYPRELKNGQYASVISKGRTGNEGFAKENLNYALRLKGGGDVAMLNFLFRSRESEDKKENYHRWTSHVGFPLDSGWHHLVVTYTFGQVGSLRAYLDGNAIEGEWDMGGDAAVSPFMDNDELWLGTAQAYSASFQGWMDELAIYRKGLQPEQVARHYQSSRRLKETHVAAESLPDDRVLVRLYEGLLDRTWGFDLDQPVLEFERSSMAMSQLPKKYNERGVIADRKLPILAQSYMKRTLPSGRFSVLLRSKNAARLWIDGKTIKSHPFVSTNGDGHEEVPKLPDPPSPNLHPIPQGHVESVTQLELEEGVHVFRLDAIVGGRSTRPEIGEVAVALASEDGEFWVLTPDGVDPWVPSESEWRRLLAVEDSEMHNLNQKLRRSASEQERDYWEERHRVGRELYLASGLPEGNGEFDLESLFKDSIAANQKRATLSDEEFLRRITLDTIGIVPTRDELAAFVADRSPRKRSMWIDKLLSDARWADHWVGYWQDVLAENPGIVKPEQNNTGPFRWWIHESFLDNKPFDRMVTELIMMEGSKFYGGPAGFAMASQNDTPMAAKAQVLTKAFLGMEMSCARCHDSPNSPFKQEELFSLAAMLQRNKIAIPATSSVPSNPDGRKPLITVSLAVGDQIAPDWHLESFPKSTLPSGLLRNPEDTREQFAAIVTSPSNRRFSRVIVNRLWHRYMGWAPVEPVDQWDGAITHDSPLLQLLERELVLSGYDLKRVAKLILNSKAYQAPTLTKKEIESRKKEGGMPPGPARRRMSAEQLVDSLLAVSGKSLDVEAMTLDPEGRRPPEQFLHLGFPTRAWQFASTSTDRDRPALMMPAVQQVSDILIAFGWRDSRPAPLTHRDESASPLQSLILGNGLASTRLARLTEESAFTEIAWKAETCEELVDQLFKTVLGRAPKGDEASLLVALLEPGFESRRTATQAIPENRKSLKRNAVSWANHLVPEATRIKLELEQEILDGDRPTSRFENDWRERMEDACWSLLNSPEFLMIP